MATKRPHESEEPKPEARQTPKPVGRPRRYETPEQMQVAIDEYFAKEESPTICGLVLALGFNSRQTMDNYMGYGPEFLDIIKRAKLRIENRYETMLVMPNVRAAGPIFALKNMGWKDSQSIAIEALPPIQMTFNSDGPACVPPDAESKAD